MKPLNIFIAIRSPILRDGIRRILASKEEIEIKGTAKDLDELNLPSEVSCTLVLGLNLLELNRFEILDSLNNEYPNLSILGIGKNEKPSHVQRIIQAGASGYICKNQDSDELIKAVKRINEGDLYLSDKAIREFYNKTNGNSSHSTVSADLTNREREILTLICQELTNREIADKLSISVRTVDAHRRNILQKTGAKNTAGLVKYAIRSKIFTLSDK